MISPLDILRKIRGPSITKYESERPSKIPSPMELLNSGRPNVPQRQQFDFSSAYGLGPLTGTQSSTLAYTPDKIPTPQSLLSTFAKEVGRGIARNVASAGLTVSGAIQRKPSPEPLSEDDFQSFLARGTFETIFGKDQEIKSIEQRVAEAEPKIKQWSEDIAKLKDAPNLSRRERFVVDALGNLNNRELAFLGIMGSVGLDLTPFGGLEKGALKTIVKETSQEGAEILLKRMGLSDDLAKTFSLSVVNTKTEKEAKALLDDLFKAKQGMEVPTTPKQYSTIHQGGEVKMVDGEPIKILDDVDTFIHKDENGNWAVSEATTGRNLTGGGYENKNSAIKAAKENLEDLDKTALQKLIAENKLPSATKAVQSVDEPLLQEARKYKSAEEFIGSLKLTEQSSPNNKVASLAKNVGVENFGGKGVFQLPKVDTNPDAVKMWETKISAGERPIIYAGSQGGFPRLIDGNNRLQAYKNLGFKEVPTVQPSQLTDIWNKAQTKIPPTEKKVVSQIPTKPVEKLPTKTRIEDTPTTQITSPLAKSDNRVSSPKSYINNVDDAIEATSRTVNEPKTVVKRVTDAVKTAKTNVLEYVQDQSERVRQLVKRPDVVVDEASDPFLKATIYPGRVDAKVTAIKSQIKTIIDESNKLAKETKATLPKIRKEVSDYLLARHAPERNLALGDGAAGITTKEARERLAIIEASPQGTKIKELANKLQDINNQTLELLKNSGVISDELFNTLKTKYKNHVPLNRVFEETDDFAQALSGKGFDVRSTGIKRAVGSEREVADIMANIVTNYEQAVLRSEKNIVDQATLNFVRKNKVVLGDLFEIQKPKPIGTGFGGQILTETTNDPSILQMFENGKKIWIKINDPALAVALRGVGKEKLGTLLNVVASFTRFYSGLATRFNPEFALPNKIRDLQEVMVYLSAQKDVGMKGAFRAVGKDPQSMKDVISGIRGLDTPGAKLYKELKEFGGTTGGMALSTRKNVEVSIEKLEKLAQSKTRNVANNLLEYVDNWNTIFEDSSRLSVYKQAISQGLSKDRAAFLAKEASVNFNRMGRGGPVINALWMFSNASIQGSMKMIRALRDPKVLMTVSTVVAGSVAAVNEFNDKVDPDWRDKVSKWDRLNGLPVVIPSTDEKFRYFTIPVSWGIKPIKVMSEYAYDAMARPDDFSVNNAIDDTLTAVLESYNPVGGSDVISALVPTILDTPVEIARNQSWTGNKIKPDFDPNAPEDIRYFSSLGDTKRGQVAISISEMLQENLGIGISPADMKHAYDQYVGGAGRFVSKVSDTAFGFATEDPVPLDEFPFISRFYRERTAEEVGAGAGGQSEELKERLEAQSRERFRINKEAEKIHEELKKLTPEEANTKFKEINKENPALGKALKALADADKLGLTFIEKKMKQLGVENEERANFIHNEIMKLPDSESRNNYYKDLKEKGIITDPVAKQLKFLAKNPQGEGAENNIVSQYITAVVTDPSNALKALFTKEKLGDVEGNLVQLQRFYGIEFSDKGGSQEYKKNKMEEMGIPWSERNSYKLEHIVPVGAGGDNSESNLLIVSKEDHDVYTPVDIAVGHAVRLGKISRRQAAKLMRDYKVEKILTIEDVYEAIK